MSKVKRWCVQEPAHVDGQHGGDVVVVPATDYDALAARVAELRAALHKYGEHVDRCPLSADIMRNDGDACTCGFSAADAGAATATHCKWTQVPDGQWDTGCGHCFEFNNGELSDDGNSNIEHCMYCGKLLDVWPYSDADGGEQS
jgi:hypothetical protein